MLSVAFEAFINASYQPSFQGPLTFLLFLFSLPPQPPSLLPSLSFSLSLSLVYVSFLFPFWQSSGTDHLFIRPETFCSEMTYLYQSQRIDFITVLTVVLAGGGENGSIID